MKVKINIGAILKKPSNAQEAIEKRDTAKWLAIGGFAAAILLVVIGGITRLDIFETVAYLVVVAAVGFFAVWYFVRKEAFRMQNAICECGEKFVFPDNVSYEVKGEQVSSGRNSNGNGSTSHTSTTVTIHCKCKCGKTHTFDSTFVTSKREMNQQGVVIRTYDYPLEKLLADFFKQKTLNSFDF